MTHATLGGSLDLATGYEAGGFDHFLAPFLLVAHLGPQIVPANAGFDEAPDFLELTEVSQREGWEAGIEAELEPAIVIAEQPSEDVSDVFALEPREHQPAPPAVENPTVHVPVEG